MFRISSTLMVLVLTQCLWFGVAKAQATAEDEQRATAGDMNDLAEQIVVSKTESPYSTLESFIRYKDALEYTIAAYLENQTWENYDKLVLLRSGVQNLIDFSGVPDADKRFEVVFTIFTLLDIFGRLPTSRLLEDAPKSGEFSDTGAAIWRIPDTPLTIQRIEIGDRAGEFLFSARTMEVAPHFFESIRKLPLESTLGLESWKSFALQFTSPLIPQSFVYSLPAAARVVWLGSPIWKIGLWALLLIVAIVVTFRIGRFSRRRRNSSPRGSLVWRMVLPTTIAAISLALFPLGFKYIALIGPAHRITDGALVLVGYSAAAWLLFLIIKWVAESIVSSESIKEGSLDANLIRLIAGLCGVVAVTLIIGIGLQAMGLPVLSLVAGLGIGGLAVALAIRPTLENLIGGIILFIDRPVRVGDFCSFGAHLGTVEKIGARSTQIRALDRTLISIPNAQFVDMELVNWAQCDSMLIQAVVGLRFETSTDQMRYFLAETRKMLHAHPRIDGETIRVRYAGPGSSSRDVEIRIYALTREWNDFHAIREDVFLRIDNIMEKAGTEYAFPSHTIYLGRDGGVDEGLQSSAEKRVDNWRQTGNLPFPRLSESQIDRLKGTLDYPPKGSAQAEMGTEGRHSPEEVTIAEPLSTAEVETDFEDEIKAKDDATQRP